MIRGHCLLSLSARGTQPLSTGLSGSKTPDHGAWDDMRASGGVSRTAMRVKSFRLVLTTNEPYCFFCFLLYWPH